MGSIDRWRLYSELESYSQSSSSNSAHQFKNGADCFELTVTDSARYPTLWKTSCQNRGKKIELVNFNFLLADKQHAALSLLRLSPDNQRLLFAIDPEGGSSLTLYRYEFGSRVLLKSELPASLYDAVWLDSEIMLAATQSEGLVRDVYWVDARPTSNLLHTTPSPDLVLTLKQSAGRTFFREGNWRASQWYEAVGTPPIARAMPIASPLSVCATHHSTYALSAGPNFLGEVIDLDSSAVIVGETKDGALVDFSCEENGLLLTYRWAGRQWMTKFDIQTGTRTPACASDATWCDKTGSLAPQKHVRHSLKFAQGEDGAQIPYDIFEPEMPSSAGPTLLYAYGAYGDVIRPELPAYAKVLIDYGWRFVIARVRGGGDSGIAWHHAGSRENKPNGISDLVRVARNLITSGQTNPKLLFARGRSAGALLVASAAQKAPNLFGGIVLDAPFLDPISALSDPKRPLAAQERSEWGDPSDPQVRAVMESYTPMNLQCAGYPRVFLAASRFDPVVPFEEVSGWANMVSTRCPSIPLRMRVGESAIHDQERNQGDELWKEVEILQFLLGQSAIEK